MAEGTQVQIYFEKSAQSLAGGESEFINGRYNNAANRCYYACFQAAIAAILKEGLSARGGHWGHEHVAGQFSGLLINRRHLYPTELRGILERNYILRQRADYEGDHVSRTETARALDRTRVFVETVEERGGVR